MYHDFNAAVNVHECTQDLTVQIVKMKTTAGVVAVVVTLVLAVSAVDETDYVGTPVNSVGSRRAGVSMLSRLRSAVKQIELLADEVNAALSIAADDHSSDANWIPTGSEMLKRDGVKRKYGRRRYDAYGVAGRFGRSAD